MNGQWIGARETTKRRVIVTRSKVGQSNLKVVFLSRELIRLAKPRPARRTIIRVRCAIGLLARSLDKLACVAVDDGRRRSKMVWQEQEDVLRTFAR